MILEIITYPNDILTTPTEDLTQADIKSGKIQTLIEDMIDTCLALDGLGLAANQVGVGKSLLVYRRPGTTDFGVLINPICIKSMGALHSKDEGCLSLPDQRFNVRRSKKVVVVALDRDGEKKTTVTKSKRLAKVLQHELDHLNGLTLIDTGKKV